MYALIFEPTPIRESLFDFINIPKEEKKVNVIPIYGATATTVPMVHFYNCGFIGVENKNVLLEQAQTMNLANDIFKKSTPLNEFESSILKRTLYMDALSAPIIPGMK